MDYCIMIWGMDIDIDMDMGWLSGAEAMVGNLVWHGIMATA